MDRRVRFVCESCGWGGADPVFDAHLNAFCPKCSRPAEFEEIARMRRERRRGARPPAGDETTQGA